MNELKYNNIKFEKMPKHDSRWEVMKVYLLHTRENENHSYFDKDVVNENLDSLYSTPVLGFINEKNEDFEGHKTNLILEVDENGKSNYKLKYMCNAYGVFDQNCDPRWETKDGKEWLVANAIIWTEKFEYVKKIFENNNWQAFQSIELFSEFEGETKNNVFYFSKYKFYGSCILGSGHQPAMGENATISRFFTNSNNSNIKIYTENDYNSTDSIMQSYLSKQGKLSYESIMQNYLKH